MVSDISDHFPTFITLALKDTNTHQTNLYKTIRNMDLDKKQAFLNSLNSLSRENVTSKTTTNEACDIFLDIFFELFNGHFPVITVKKNKKSFMT